jgi:hypothetical protein
MRTTDAKQVAGSKPVESDVARYEKKSRHRHDFMPSNHKTLWVSKTSSSLWSARRWQQHRAAVKPFHRVTPDITVSTVSGSRRRGRDASAA